MNRRPPRSLVAPTAGLVSLFLLAACDAPSSHRAEPAPPRMERRDAGPSIAERTGGTRAELDRMEIEPAPAPAQLVAAPSGGAASPAPEKAPEPASGPVLARPHAADPDVDHLAAGEAALEKGDGEAALEAFRLAAFDTHGYDAFMGVSRAALETGDRELALEALEAAAGADPEQAEPLLKAARLCLGAKEIARGLRFVDRAIVREPERADAFNVRGRLEMARQQYDRALIAFDRAIDLDPAYVWAYNNMGYVELLVGRYEDAVESLEVATTLRPVTAYMFNNLGLAYEKTGRIVDAWHAFNEALSMKPAYVNAQINLDRVRTVAMNRAEDAKASRGSPLPSALPSRD